MNHNSLGCKQPYHTGLDVKMEVTQCAGHVSANTRCHQLRWGDRELAYYMSCARNTDIHVRAVSNHCTLVVFLSFPPPLLPPFFLLLPSTLCSPILPLSLYSPLQFYSHPLLLSHACIFFFIRTISPGVNGIREEADSSQISWSCSILHIH